MDAAAWAPLYAEILRDFAYDRKDDERARDELDALLVDRREADLDALRARFAGREAWIVGAAAKPGEARRAGAPLVVTDGAARVALAEARADILVTDLDGDVDAQARANAEGAVAFLHAHGDNLDALRANVPRFRGPIVGTTQADALGRVRAFGGFTDGDRACCIAVALGASSLALVGFDFDAPVEKSGRDAGTKRRKLAWARRIIDALDVPVRHA